ncbi:HAMP domain-containing sensor histidine kinase [Propionivibrio limicola]|uniref:HAMP domain-containing sensor histidine kinase n=1 Tax=Propionivibrio limicola TaxID=167645 RepID=UPI001290A6F3|nr:ATP-binding protein [Propionivibrio limicola]
MIRISFRQGMLAGFLLIALLLGGAAIQSWWLLERFVAQNRHGNEVALKVAAATRELAERSVDLERSARQFLVLKDAAVLGRFDEQAAAAQRSADYLETLPGNPLAPHPAAWREAVATLGHGLHRVVARDELTRALDRLAEINNALELRARDWIEQQQLEAFAALEQNRRQLGWRVAGAVAGALLVALAMGWWLTRPLAILERAIERLGGNRLDEPVTVGGPADLRQVGRQLDWLRQRLGELERERQQTLRHVSHELKTPLAALREGVALLQDGVVGPLDATQQEVVTILQQNAMTLQRQIEGLLRLNAVAFDAHRLQLQPTVLTELLAEAVRERELQIQARGLAVSHEAPSVTLGLDREKLRVVLDNLLSNAIDFSPPGGSVRLLAACDGGSKRLRIDCLDEGPGVAKADAERIFEPFVQGQHAAPLPRQGSGVGLSIVRELVGGMGGEVRLVDDDDQGEDAPGNAARRGAHFRIEVPYEMS